jgi:hypothetical protein
VAQLIPPFLRITLGSYEREVGHLALDLRFGCDCFTLFELFPAILAVLLRLEVVVDVEQVSALFGHKDGFRHFYEFFFGS